MRKLGFLASNEYPCHYFHGDKNRDVTSTKSPLMKIQFIVLFICELQKIMVLLGNATVNVLY